jgi:hypothetical protein
LDKEGWQAGRPVLSGLNGFLCDKIGGYELAIPIFKNGYEVSAIHPPPPAVFSSLLKKL